MEVVRLGGVEPAPREGFDCRPGEQARSVVLTETGLSQAEAAFHRLFED